MKTLSIKFITKPFKNKEDKIVIHTRLVYDRTKAEFSTGLHCLKNQWDDIREVFRHSAQLNQKLAQISEKIYRAKNDLDDLNRGFGASDIKDLLHAKKRGSNVLLIEFFAEYLENKQADGQVKRRTVTKYYQTYNRLEDFLTKNKIENIVLAEVDIKFISDFNTYVSRLKLRFSGDRMKQSTISKHHARIKAVLNAAIRKGYILQNPYINFKLSFPNGNREYLSLEELERLKKLDFDKKPTLDRIRDIFLFSCYTGLRYSDAIGLTMDRITSIGRNLYITIDQGKTGERREIPLLDAASHLIEKYTLSPSRLIRNRVLPTYTNVTINKYLKVVARMAEITKPLTHHIARHTCATTVLLDNGVALETVSHWLGHNSVRTTQIYAKISHTKLSAEQKRLNKILS